MKLPFYVLALGAVLLVLIPGKGTFAAPEEIQVYTYDVNEPREFSVELHTNYVIEGPRTSQYPGQLPTNHVLQFTPEFSYGIAKNWDIGLYLLSGRSADGNLYGNGAKLRLKYMSAGETGTFWGVNMEYGRTSKRVSENSANIELRPIIGWRNDLWLVSFNPILGAAVSGDVSGEPSFAPALKVSRRAGDGLQVGFEHYADMGGIHHMPSFNQQEHTFFAVADYEAKGFDINLGIGRAVTSATPEKWVAKMIIGIPFK